MLGVPSRFACLQDLEAVTKELHIAKERITRLEHALMESYSRYAPPAQFLPPHIYDRYKEAAMVLEEYAVLYRQNQLHQLMHQDAT